MLIRSISAILAFTLFSTPTFSNECSPQEAALEELRLLLKENPEEMAKRESTLESPSFFAVYGYDAQIVGVSSGLSGCALSAGRSKPMPGTSDYLCTDEIVNLQPAARSFAARHNVELAKLIEVECF